VRAKIRLSKVSEFPSLIAAGRGAGAAAGGGGTESAFSRIEKPVSPWTTASWAVPADGLQGLERRAAIGRGANEEAGELVVKI
jgi:hypothetical protein